MKVIRSICLHTKDAVGKETKLLGLAKRLEDHGFIVQTKRLCSPTKDIRLFEASVTDPNILLSVGKISHDEYSAIAPDFLETQRTSLCVDLTQEEINEAVVQTLFDIIKTNPQKTFNFAYVFNDLASSPFFPSAFYEQEGFSIGLQSTDLSENLPGLQDWLDAQKTVWSEIIEIFKDEQDFLGIDSSIAPLFHGVSSLADLTKRICGGFSESVMSDFYVNLTRFIKTQNPKPIGLCGLMLPCLEDFELAEEYSQGEFSLERNLFLSLHSGLGIDTYPMGIDEDMAKLASILKLVQGLSNKYKKPLSVRFVSDGKAKIGEMTDFKNQYLKDVIVRSL
ncbi:MAG: DUF711 family protein [Patescibacteria group bacterium]|nr:DUF711 family protein [Patescibacteria group bacterium]